jgi:hypothetical protein
MRHLKKYKYVYMLVMADGSNCSNLFADHASMQLVLAGSLFFCLLSYA